MFGKERLKARCYACYHGSCSARRIDEISSFLIGSLKPPQWYLPPPQLTPYLATDLAISQYQMFLLFSPLKSNCRANTTPQTSKSGDAPTTNDHKYSDHKQSLVASTTRLWKTNEPQAHQMTKWSIELSEFDTQNLTQRLYNRTPQASRTINTCKI